jgi:hypothetical protein
MADALQNILTETGLAIAPLRSINSPERAIAFFRQLGYDFSAGAFGSSLSQLGGHATELIAGVQQLAAAHSEEDVAAAVVNLLQKIVATVDAIRQLHEQIQVGGGAGIPNLSEFPRRLTDFLVLDYLHRQHTDLHEILLLLGLIEHEPTPAPNQPMRLVNWERFGTFLTNPGQIANDVYKWDSDFDTDKFLARLERVMRAAALPGGLYPQADTTKTVLGNTAAHLRELRFPIFQKGLTPATYSQFGITFSPAEAQGGKKKGIALLPYIMGAADFQFDVCDRGELAFESSADIKGVGLVVRPPFNVDGILNLTGAFKATVSIREKSSKATETILIGSQGGTRLAIQGLGIKWFAQNPQGKFDVGFEGEIQAIRLVISGGEGDGFIQKILSGLNVQAEASLALGMTLLTGFTFRGGAKLALEIPTHIDLGPIQIQGLRLTIGPAIDKINFDAGALLKLDLGPLKAVVENIGVTSGLNFRQGNLGPVDLDIGFKPPNGVGLSIDTGVVKGGGFLRFNYEKGEYFGALELSIQNTINLKAIGIINTKMPDGSPGFALLILITAEFTPIQLGIGFSLMGVGGLLGLNHSTNIDALKSGVRTGAVSNILFPEDVVANITRIISDMTTIFPIVESHFIVAPMGKLGWFTPPLITLEMGIILDIPSPTLVIIGVLRCVLPEEKAPILKLQVNFAGGIDFNKGIIWFDASLFDSSILVYTLTGDMALRIGWGDSPLFILSVGGFHPAFHEVPPDLTNMTRLTISLLSGNNPRLVAQTYFAVTSNTVQSGAKVELYAEACGFNVYGFLGYDLLVRFQPLYFIADIYAGLALRSGSSEIAGINVHCELSGPTPWHALGDASLDILFFSISVGFDQTWGESAPPQVLEPADVLALLVDALTDSRNWKTDIPANTNLSVSVKQIELLPGEIILHPFGVLTVTQKVVPLKLTINKFGNKQPKADTLFDISYSGGNTAYEEEQFAPAQFLQMNDAEKLSRKSFENMKSGLRFQASDATSHGAEEELDVVYDLIYVHKKKFLTIRAGIIRFFDTVFQIVAKGNAAAKSSYSVSKKKASNAPAKVEVAREGYKVVNVSDMEECEGSVAVATESEAYAMHDTLIAKNPSLKGNIQVVSTSELN